MKCLELQNKSPTALLQIFSGFATSWPNECLRRLMQHKMISVQQTPLKYTHSPCLTVWIPCAALVSPLMLSYNRPMGFNDVREVIRIIKSLKKKKLNIF